MSGADARPLFDALDRAATYAGAVGAVVAFAAILLSTLLAPWFSWTGNALSELGAPAADTAPIFNWGLRVAGVLGVLFVLRVGLECRNLVHRVGTTVLLGATVSLTAIGAFPAGHPLHNPASLSFFVLLSYGLLAYGSGDVLAGRPRVGVWTIWLGALNMTGWLVWAVVYFTGYVGTYDRPGVAIPEFVGAIALAAWVLPATRKLLRGATDAEGDSGGRPADPGEREAGGPEGGPAGPGEGAD